MRKSLLLAALLVTGAVTLQGCNFSGKPGNLFVPPAQAQTAEPSPVNSAFCDTADQARRYVALVEGGADPDEAAKLLDKELGTTDACARLSGLAIVGSPVGEPIPTKEGRKVVVREVLVVAVFMPTGLVELTVPVVQFCPLYADQGLPPGKPA